MRNILIKTSAPSKQHMILKVKKNSRYPESFSSILFKMGNLGGLEVVDEPVKDAWSFIVDTVEYFIPATGQVNTAEIKSRLMDELAYTRGFLASVMKKLGNEKFVNGAPSQVVANERKKQADAEAKIASLESQISEL